MATAVPAPEEEFALARQALEQNDLPLAAEHAALALAADPMWQEGIDLLDSVIAVATDPLALVPLDGDAPSPARPSALTSSPVSAGSRRPSICCSKWCSRGPTSPTSNGRSIGCAGPKPSA
jgi:hypothetical protein